LNRASLLFRNHASKPGSLALDRGVAEPQTGLATPKRKRRRVAETETDELLVFAVRRRPWLI